jgi:hypothetical protein
MADKYQTIVETAGPAVALDVCPGVLGRWLARRGFTCKVVISKVNGQELSDDEMDEVAALFEAAEE